MTDVHGSSWEAKHAAEVGAVRERTMAVRLYRLVLGRPLTRDESDRVIAAVDRRRAFDRPNAEAAELRASLARVGSRRAGSVPGGREP